MHHGPFGINKNEKRRGRKLGGWPGIIAIGGRRDER
jgi:hypothetical protein